jgi:hypothetical protein
MMRTSAGALLAIVMAGLAQEAPSSGGALTRRYRDGEQLTYLMKGRNNDRPYEVRLTAHVKKGGDGQFVEEFAWSDLSWGGTPQPLTPASRDFRQAFTLTGSTPFTFPDLSRVQPGLIGPVTDLLTFYADLFLAINEGKLREPGDAFFFPSSTISSWADGTRVLIGEDEIDFDVRLTRLDRTGGTATLLVKHVPPKAPKIKVPAEWMRAPVAGVPNNWVQVRRDGTAYRASVGKETFDVELTIGLARGEIIAATLDNLVEAVSRQCTDAALTACAEARPDRIVRRIEMTLIDR